MRDINSNIILRYQAEADAAIIALDSNASNGHTGLLLCSWACEGWARDSEHSCPALSHHHNIMPHLSHHRNIMLCHFLCVT